VAILCKNCNEDNRMKMLIAFFRDRTGATAIEYALIAAGISVAIVAGVSSLSSTMGTKYDTIKAAVQ